MKIAFVADPLEALDASTDTTVGLMHAAQRLGAEVWFCGARDLEVVDGRARARASRSDWAPSRPGSGGHWVTAAPWCVTAAPERVWLDQMAAVFLRVEPPLDEAYLTAALILDLIDPDDVALVNDPRGVRAVSEHLFPLAYPDLIPPTLVTADRDALRDFVAEHRNAVIKPVDGFSGR